MYQHINVHKDVYISVPFCQIIILCMNMFWFVNYALAGMVTPPEIHITTYHQPYCQTYATDGEKNSLPF